MKAPIDMSEQEEKAERIMREKILSAVSTFAPQQDGHAPFAATLTAIAMQAYHQGAQDALDRVQERMLWTADVLQVKK